MHFQTKTKKSATLAWPNRLHIRLRVHFGCIFKQKRKSPRRWLGQTGCIFACGSILDAFSNKNEKVRDAGLAKPVAYSLAGPFWMHFQTKTKKSATLAWPNRLHIRLRVHSGCI